jgi:hypothetical protein
MLKVWKHIYPPINMTLLIKTYDHKSNDHQIHIFLLPKFKFKLVSFWNYAFLGLTGVPVENQSCKLKPSIGSHTKIWAFLGLLRTFLLFNWNFQYNFLMIKYKSAKNFVVQDWKLLEAPIQKVGCRRSESESGKTRSI